ncbi:MAG: acyltransferase [Deltaproteobacteria bacterium]|nr:acyltransferase [Deltaproteobacteria bacterium]
MKIGFVQFAPVFGEVASNLARAKTLLAGFDGDIVVLPEFFNSGYLFVSKDEVERLAEEIPTGPTTTMLLEIARAQNIHIVAGLPERAGERFFNSAVVVSPQGLLGTYRKSHLFFEEKLFFTHGDTGMKVFDIAGCKVGVMVCFDWFFPETMRVLALAGADLVCHCANLVLPFCQNAMVTRCLENGVFAITANRTGNDIRGAKRLDFTGASQITGPRGEILYRATAERDEVFSVEVDIHRSRDKQLNPFNDLFADRRVDCYGAITTAL